MNKPIPSIYELENNSYCVLYLNMQDKGNKLIDHSGCGNHGTNTGGLFVPDANGLVWQTDGIDDTCSFTNTTSLVYPYNTIECWVKVLDTTIYNPVVSKAGVSGHGWKFYIKPGGQLCLFSRFPSGGTEFDTGYIVSNAWTHIVCQFGVGYRKFWINGGQVTGSTGTNLCIGNTAASPLALASTTANGAGMAKAKFGIIRMFNGFTFQLTDTDVLNLYKENAWRYGLKA